MAVAHTQNVDIIPLVHQIAQEIPRLVDAKKAADLKVYPATFNNCSEVGHDCERYLVYRRTESDKQKLPDVGLRYAADEGDLHHVSMRRMMEDLGFKLGEIEATFTWKEMHLRGRIDGTLVGDRNGHFPKAIPFDFKSVSTHIFKSINTPEDIWKNKWTRKYIAQMTAYCLMLGKEAGLFIIKNRDSGRYKSVPVVLDLDFAEAMLKKIERVNGHVAAKTLPDRIEYSEDTCDHCPFFDVCLPETSHKGMRFLTEDELVSKFNQLSTLEGPAKEYEALKKELTEFIKIMCHDKEKGEQFVIGDKFGVKANWQVKNISAKNAYTQEFWMTKIMPLEKMRV